MARRELLGHEHTTYLAASGATKIAAHPLLQGLWKFKLHRLYRPMEEVSA